MIKLFILILITCSMVYSQENNQQWMQLTLQGEQFFDQGDLGKALDSFIKAERLEQKSTRIYINLAICYRALRDRARNTDSRRQYDQNYEHYLKQTLKLDSIHSDARYLLDKRLGIIPVSIPFKNKDARQLYEAAVTAIQSDSPASARKLLERAKQLEPHPEIIKAQGMLAFRDSDLDSADGYLQQALELDPLQYDAAMALGQIVERRQEYTRAKLYYIKALAAYPHFFEGMTKISVISRKQGQAVQFLNLFDPIPADRQETPYNDMTAMRKLAEDLQHNVFDLQCWLVYHAEMRRLRKEYSKALPGVVFEKSIEHEVTALGTMLDFYHKHQEKIGVTLQQLEILYRLKTKGLLKAAAFFYRWNDEYAKDLVEYRRLKYDEFVRMFEEHLLRPVK